jgi:hypothetical protein
VAGWLGGLWARDELAERSILRLDFGLDVVWFGEKSVDGCRSVEFGHAAGSVLWFRIHVDGWASVVVEKAR